MEHNQEARQQTMKLTKLYTRTGDKGQTSLIGGTRVDKDSARLEAYGTVDELNSQLGVLAAALQKTVSAQPLASDITQIQRHLFALGSFLALDQQHSPLYDSCRVKSDSVAWLEHNIDSLQHNCGALPGFILPGGTTEAAQTHVCRTVCRRAERRIIALAHSIPTPENTSVATPEEGWDDAIRYINRLSDYLFALARELNRLAGTPDTLL